MNSSGHKYLCYTENYYEQHYKNQNQVSLQICVLREDQKFMDCMEEVITMIITGAT